MAINACRCSPLSSTDFTRQRWMLPMIYSHVGGEWAVWGCCGHLVRDSSHCLGSSLSSGHFRSPQIIDRRITTTRSWTSFIWRSWVLEPSNSSLPSTRRRQTKDEFSIRSVRRWTSRALGWLSGCGLYPPPESHSVSYSNKLALLRKYGGVV